MNNTLKGLVMVVILLVTAILNPIETTQDEIQETGVLSSFGAVVFTEKEVEPEVLSVVAVAPGREIVPDIEEFIVTKEDVDTGDEISIHQLQDSQYASQDFDLVEDEQSGVNVSDVTPHSVVNNNLVDREVLGFLPYWYWPTKSNSELQYDKLSTIAYFGLTCGTLGQWITDDPGYTAFYSANFTDMLARAHANNTKVVVTVKNFDAQSITKIVSNVNEAGDTLINNIVDVVRARGLDGVNIDFEYVASGDWPVTDGLRANFVSWHESLAQRMHSEFPGSHVSTDVYASSSLYYKAYDMTELGKTSLDYIMVMTYDYFTTNSTVAGPTAPLYGDHYWYTVSEAMNAIGAEAPKDKLLMGIPYYGLEFPVSTTSYNSAKRGTGPVYTATYSAVTNPIYDVWHNGSTLRWEEADKVRWYVYRYPNMATDPLWQGYYEDESTIAAKYDFVRSQGIGGIGIWALGYDTGRDQLWNSIRDNFQSAPFPVSFHSNVTESEALQILDAAGVDIVDQEKYNIWIVRPRNSRLTKDLIAILRQEKRVSSIGYSELGIERDILRSIN